MTRCPWLCLSVAAAAVTGASAEVDPCEPMSCSQVSVAQPPGFNLPNPATFVPDRRPAVAVVLWAGSCGFPPAGGMDWWLDLNDSNGNGIVDSVDVLLDSLDQLFRDGWRRMILVLPAGSLEPQDFSSSQWWPIPDIKRQDLTLYLRSWILGHPAATIGIYTGFQIGKPCSLCMEECHVCVNCGQGAGCNMCPDCTGVPPAHSPRTTSFADMCTVYRNIEPWIEMGVHEIWFDAAGGAMLARWPFMLRLAGDPDYAGRVRFGIEPVIHATSGNGQNVPLLPVLSMASYVSTRWYYEVVGGNAPPGSWDFDPDTTEVLVMLRDGDFCIDANPNDNDPCTGCGEWCQGTPDPPAIDVVYEYVQRGYIPYSMWEPVQNYVRRIYNISPQTIPCPWDLDASETFDMSDVMRLVANFGMTRGATLYHGDLDHDGDVDAFDFIQIISQFAYLGPHCDHLAQGYDA